MHVNSDLYVLAFIVLEGRTPIVLLPVDVHSIVNTADPIFRFKFGWYEL